MTEQEFLDACDRVLEAIEDAIDASGIDADTERAGQVLTLEFDDGSKIIVNGNAPVREIWTTVVTNSNDQEVGRSSGPRRASVMSK